MSSLCYVYCVVLSDRRPAIGARVSAAGMPGGRDTRAVPAGDDLWLIVTNVPVDEYGEAALARGLQNLEWVGPRAMAHEAVVEQFLSSRAVVPMQLFTLFTSDERALQHVERQRKEIRAVVRRLERKVEWGLRLTFDEQAVRDAVDAAAPTTQGGTGYLTRKRDLLNVHRVQLKAAKSEADQMFTALTKEAADARRRTATEDAAPGARLLLDAAFLVPSAKTRMFRAAVSRRAKAIGAAGVVVSLTGPWPAYNFIPPRPPRASAKQVAPARGARSKRGKAAR